MLLPFLALITLLAVQAGQSSPPPPAAAVPAPPTPSSQTSTPVPTRELAIPLDRTTRLLVVSPHPDDETLGAAGLIQRVRAKGGAVRVVLMTSGDGFPEGVERAEGVTQPKASDYRAYGQTRERETLAAMTLLGLSASQVNFLGYPDEGLCHLASTYLFDKTKAYQSPYTSRATPPPTERLIRGARYRGIDLRREIESIITGFAPTLIVLPFSGDDHPDHCATHTFVREALEAVSPRVSRRVQVLHFLVHYAQWPLTADAGVGTLLLPPAGFPAREGSFVSLTLTDEESVTKKKALLAYTTQMEVIGRFMTAFGRDNELFIEGEPAEPLSCWCEDGEDAAPPPRSPSPERRPDR